ncbi:competence protein CoiA family protein [Streptomyces sp. NRRL WC-3626]|uniref:competence protein CoiA family protein n=1 Tax=Streptomyces sp. NRRL WC-3626 TaxID=1463926 RepID=UPI000ABC3BA6|nr:competence protein CoiA family protein [Streptomyces sp. NRRL WC-3626]
MPSHVDDTRKVQTAVTGRPGSDSPVFLPFDHDDFDLFMHGRTREDFYCGVLLGGCGKKLTAKRYLDKKCHFAHRPPVHCRRARTGEDSADHLYIGQALQRWLRARGHPDAEVTYPDLGPGPGGVVEVRFGSGRRLIRVQMSRLPLAVWQRTRAELSDGSTRVHWAYGPDSGLAHNEVRAEGHALRFTCRTERGTRQVYVGTQDADHSVESTTLEHCALTDDGIVTPRLAATLRAVAPEPAQPSPAFPLLPGSVAFTASVALEADAGDPAHRLYEADVQPTGSGMLRMRLALPSDVEPPLPHRLNLVEGSARLGAAGDGWLIRALGYSALAKGTDPRWPALRPSPEPREPETLPPPRPEAPARTASLPTLTSEERALVESFRSRLAKVARSHGVINWETLISYAGHAPADFTPEDRVRLLVAVGHTRSSGGPVLASLVKLAGQRPGLPPFFRDVLTGLGWDPGLPEAKVEDIWSQQQKAAHRATWLPTATTTKVPLTVDAELVGRLRQHLQLVARGRGLIRWSNLLKKAGVAASTVAPHDGVRLLVAVDSPYASDRPVLSSLIRADSQQGGPVALFDKVLRELGRPPSAGVPGVAAAWKAERERAYALVSRSARGGGTPQRPTEGGVFWSKRGLDRKAVIASVRAALVSAARRRVKVGWHTLAAAAGLSPDELSDRTRALILTEVDRPAGPGGVLLSSLVISAENTPVPYFADILKALDRPHTDRPIELGRLRKLEQARVFAAFETSTEVTNT